MMRSTCATILLVLAAAAPAPGGEVIDRVLAVVGGQVVTLSDARAALEFGLVAPAAPTDPVADAVEYLVNRQLMLSEVDRYSAPSADAAAIDARVAAIRAFFADDAGYPQALARTALTEARLRDLLGDKLRIEAYLDQRFSGAAQPTPEEVHRYYVDHRAEFTRDGQLLPFEEVQAEALASVTTERRNFLIAEWLDRLRRRAVISVELDRDDRGGYRSAKRRISVALNAEWLTIVDATLRRRR